MKVLIGCEKSQAVMSEFRKLGHQAYSCDTEPSYGDYPQYHLQMDINDAINLGGWHFIGIHPPCTCLTVAGNRTYSHEKVNERSQAIEWTIALWNNAIRNALYVYMENPVGVLNKDTRLPKPQIIHPYYFGDEAQKQTCLWLHNLPPLYHSKYRTLFDNEITHVSPGQFYEWNDKKTGRKKRQPLWYSVAKGCGGKQVGNTSDIRSKTFPGIARAIANQYSKLII